MIYVHSLGRAFRFYPGRTALAREGRLLTFRELHTRVEGIAGTLTSHGFGEGDRLALLLPNGPDYIELLYACSMLGVIAVPLNTRLSTKEIDRVLEDARPHGRSYSMRARDRDIACPFPWRAARLCRCDRCLVWSKNMDLPPAFGGRCTTQRLLAIRQSFGFD